MAPSVSPLRNRHFRTLLIAAVVVSVAALFLVPAGAGLPLSGQAGAPRTAVTTAPAVATHLATARASIQDTASNYMVDAAVASLNHGAGPALGVSGACAATAGGQATCGRTPTPAHSSHAAGQDTPALPAPVPATPHWYNVSASLSTASGGVTPAVGFGGRMAYDPLLKEVVLFNGCSRTVCPANDTWAYNGLTWTNLTGTLKTAPSPREGAGLAYDPAFGGVILFGGSNVLDENLNDTWLFTGAGWSNITATVGTPVDIFDGPVSWSWGAMAWDPGLGTLIVVDGCYNAACNEVYDQEWTLNVSGWTPSWGPGPVEATYLAYNSVAWDGADGYLVAFGGYDDLAGVVENYTYTLSSAYVWTNITDTDHGCSAGKCYTPPARDSEAMTWDAALNAVFMTSGFNYTTETWLNDSWTFSGGVWFPADLTAPEAPVGFCGTAQPGLAGMSDNIAPFILGGYGPSCGSYDFSNEWVYEAPPQPTLTASPNPQDVGGATTVTAGWTVGTGTGIEATWNVSYGDGHFAPSARSPTDANTSTSYSVSSMHTFGVGTFKANATWTDFFYISGEVTGVSITVYPALVATITASALNISTGGAVTFTTAPTGGSGTYTYAWEFGDGTTSAVQDPAAHTYAKAGTYVVNLTVTDTAGGLVKSSVTITVTTPPAKAGLFGLSGSTGYILIGVIVLVLVVLVVALLMRRKKPTQAPVQWQGAPPPGAGAPPPGAAGGPPPGAGGPPPPPPA